MSTWSSRPGRPVGRHVGAYQRRGAVTTLTLVAQRVPFQAMFNATGQPAAVVPWGLDDDGVPDVDSTRGQAIRRGHPVVARCADREGAAVGAAQTAGVRVAQRFSPGRQLVVDAHGLRGAGGRQPAIAQRPVDACEAREFFSAAAPLKNTRSIAGYRRGTAEVVGHHAVQLDRRVETANTTAPPQHVPDRDTALAQRRGALGVVDAASNPKMSAVMRQNPLRGLP